LLELNKKEKILVDQSFAAIDKQASIVKGGDWEYQTLKSSPNNVSNYAIRENKTCVCKNCNRIGKNSLKIVYINKIGWFCDLCKDDLLNQKLVLEQWVICYSS
jgi:hypothetical protein